MWPKVERCPAKLQASLTLSLSPSLLLVSLRSHRPLSRGWCSAVKDSIGAYVCQCCDLHRYSSFLKPESPSLAMLILPFLTFRIPLPMHTTFNVHRLILRLGIQTHQLTHSTTSPSPLRRRLRRRRLLRAHHYILHPTSYINPFTWTRSYARLAYIARSYFVLTLVSSLTLPPPPVSTDGNDNKIVTSLDIEIAGARRATQKTVKAYAPPPHHHPQ